MGNIDIIYEHYDADYVYGKDYTSEYKKREESKSDIVLNKLRVNLVRKYCDFVNPAFKILDFGCGTGSFIKAMYADNLIKVYGYDVMDDTYGDMMVRGIFHDPYKNGFDFDIITYWDSFEHLTVLLHTPLIFYKKMIIMSVPVFECDHKKSKHYKPAEHLWYFTKDGITSYMKQYGFVEVERTDMEQRAGRENVMTYVFRKKENA